MDHNTAMFVLVAFSLLLGFYGFTRVMDAIEHLHYDVRGLTRDLSEIDAEHGRVIRRTERKVEGALEGLTDIRVHQENQ